MDQATIKNHSNASGGAFFRSVHYYGMPELMSESSLVSRDACKNHRFTIKAHLELKVVKKAP